MTRGSILGCAGLAALALMAWAPAAMAQEGFSGRWQTNMGAMRIDEGDDGARGEYEMKDGRVRGHIDGDSFTGIWTQSSSGHRCFEERMGSEYWGRFSLSLNERGDRFYGRWSYCNDEPGSGGVWNGERD